MKRFTSISHHVVQFCRTLRNEHFLIGPGEEKDALEALATIAWEDPDQFKLALQSTLCKSYQHILQFEDIYSRYWKELNRAVDSKEKKSPSKNRQSKRKETPSIEVIKNWLRGNPQLDQTSISKPGEDIVSGGMDLTKLPPYKVKEWREVVYLIQQIVAKSPSRRTIPGPKSGIFDYRRTLAQNLSIGGEIVHLKYRRKKDLKTQIILLCDVSKSMELYSRFMIHMMYALQNSSLNLQTFVFSTALYNITRKLKTSDIKKSLNDLSHYVDQWSSGTKIGYCLNEFLERFGDRYLNRRTFIFIVSDGWDSGDISLMDSSMDKLKKRVKKIIWINPLAQSKNYRPEVLGMKAALPYIDALVPALNASTLKRYLANLR